MKLINIFLAVFPLIALSAGAESLIASEITDVQVYSESDYVRVAFSLDSPVMTQLETNAREQLLFVRFQDTKVDKLGRQSFLYETNPHLESLTFLPIGGKATVARIKVRHQFKVRTFEIKNPPRFVVELSGNSKPAGSSVNSIPGGGYYQRGLRYLQEGNGSAALMAFRSAIRAGERVADSYYHAGLIRYRQNELDKSLINLSRAQQSAEYGNAARLYLSWINYKKGDVPALKVSWKNFVGNLPEEKDRIKLAADFPEIDYRALETASADGSAQAPQRVDIPVKTAAPVTELPTVADSGQVYFQKGMKAKEDGYLDQAAAYLEKSVNLDRKNKEAFFQLGAIYKALGKNQKSSDYFEKSLGSTPSLEGIAETIKGEATAAESNQPPITAAADLEGRPENIPAQQEVKQEVSETPAAEKILPAIDAQESEKLQVKAESQAISLPAGKGSILKTLRMGAARIIPLRDAGLLRRQVKFLVTVLGLLFLVALAGEKFFLRKKGRRIAVLPGKKYASFGRAGKNAEPEVQEKAAENIGQKKRQLEEVLARELAAKRNAVPLGEGYSEEFAGRSEGKLHRGGEIMELRFQPISGSGVYGADIARRIKEELQKDGNGFQTSPASGHFSRGKDDLQTRLIRQLRSRHWTISDIAQEMNVSREEIKWALAGNSAVDELKEEAGDEEAVKTRYGQARGLFGARNEGIGGEKPGEIDREVDFELQINV